ncbi:MAG TPA: hypothetical protein VJ572_10545, partial [Azonexus sp.]|nr:hypothetical protein [Azonexus sp.]
MISPAHTPFSRLAVAGLLLALLGACSILDASKETQPAFYSLYGARPDAQPATASPAPWALAPTLIVNPPRA